MTGIAKIFNANKNGISETIFQNKISYIDYSKMRFL